MWRRALRMDREARNNHGTTQRSPWRRSRLVRYLRRPHGPARQLLCHAGRLLQSRLEEGSSCGRIDAGRVWRAKKRSNSRYHRNRWVAHPSQTQECGTHFARDSSVTPTADEHGSDAYTDPAFRLAAASLRQALQSFPELTEASKHIFIQETKEGLNIEIVDQDGRSMFPEGSNTPYERMRVIIQKLAGPLNRRHIGFPLPVTRLQPERCRYRIMESGDYRSIAQTPCARSLRRRAILRPTSIKWPARPIRLRSSRKIRLWRPTGALQLRWSAKRHPCHQIYSLELQRYPVSRFQESLRQHTTFPTTSSSLSGTSSLPCLGLSEMIFTCACFAGRITCNRLITMPANASRMA